MKPITPAARAAILDRVLGAIERNRTPGYHFAGNLLALSFDKVDPADTRISLDGGPHCMAADGQMDLPSFFVLADMALAISIRAEIRQSVRMATVGMQLQFTGAPRGARLVAKSRFRGFLDNSAGRQGLTEVHVFSGKREVCFGTGAFMVLPPPRGFKLPPLVALRAQPPRITPADLTPEEQALYARAQQALQRVREPGDAFIDRFWDIRARVNQRGASATLKNGQHVGNRVGHVQGGLLLGLAESAARAALPSGWTPSAVAACYLSPGEGASLTARARVVHQGSRTAVVRTLITGVERRRVHETLMTWAAPQ